MVSLLAAGVYSKSSNRFFFYTMLFIFLWLLAGLRGDVGQDTQNYGRHFYLLEEGMPFLDYFSSIEPVFAGEMVLFSVLFDDVTWFFLFYSFVQALFLIYILKSVSHKILFLFFYLFLYYLEFHMNILRAGLAVQIFVVSLILQPSRKSFAFLVLSIMTHFSIVYVSPVFLFRLRSSFGSKVSILAVCSICVALLFVFIGGAISDKFEVYFLSSGNEFEVPTVAFIMGIFLLVFVLANKSVSPPIVVSFILFFVAWIGVGKFEIFYRLYGLSFFVFMFLLFEERVIFGRDHGYSFRPLFMGALPILIWFLIVISYGYVTERERRVAEGLGDPEFSFIPYSAFYDSKVR